MTATATRAGALLAGNVRFVAAESELCRDVASRRREAAAHHAPAAAILACADARVAPELVFDQGVGELFAVRVAGNVAARAAVASLDYAVDQLDVDLVLVLGHEGCGAVTAAVEHVVTGAPVPEELLAVVEPIVPAVLATIDPAGDLGGDLAADLAAERVHRAVVANVLATVERLRATPGPLGRRARAGTVEVVGAVYDLESGRVRLLGTEPVPWPAPSSPTPTSPTGETPQ